MIRAARTILGALAVTASVAAGCTPADNAAAGAKSFFNEIGDKVTDASIDFAIKAAYVDDQLVKSKQLTISTRDGEVTLRGTQPSLQAKARAIEIARGTKGVKAVYDGITVQGMEPAPVGSAPPVRKTPSGPPPAGSQEPGPVVPPASVWQ